MYYIIFFVPKEHAETVKESIFEAGGGTLGNYSRCSFDSWGRGQFMPLAGSSPFVGEAGRLEKVDEIKVEIFCRKENLEGAIKALKASHPYETPAYYVIESFQ